MHPSKQKLDIDERRAALEGIIKKLQHDVSVLKAGMKRIDEGGNILEERGFLMEEVRKIMRGNPTDL